jgi:cyclopropane fatty-acyl-phospholipid synthase-like methyltransferase
LGCGTGAALLPYYKKNHTVIGLDLSPKNIEICKNIMPAGQFDVASICDLDLSPYQDATHIICHEVIEHLPEWQSLIRTLETAPSGATLHLTTPHQTSERTLLALRPSYWQEIGHHHFFDGTEITEALNNAGYTVHSCTKHNAALYFELKALFKRNAPCIRNTYYENTLPLPLKLWFQSMRPSVFTTRMKWIPLWVIALPIARVLDRWYGAGITIAATKR